MVVAVVVVLIVRGGVGGVQSGWGGRVMHSRSRMTIDLRIPTIPGRSTSYFHRPSVHGYHQARRGVWCLVSRIEGELHVPPNGGHDEETAVLATKSRKKTSEFLDGLRGHDGD